MPKKNLPPTTVRPKPPRSLDIRTPGRPGVCVPKSLRVKQTVYLSSDTRKLLRLRAIEDDCELSEVAEHALGAYLRE